MGLKFNPLTAQFDLTGSGGGGGASYIDGEVATYNDLPLDGTAALNSAWLVRTASGVWPVSRKQAGIYIRTATAGSSRDADYTYAGTMPDVFSDSVFLLYDEASTTRTGQFNLGSITAGQNRVLTWPDGNGTIARTSDIPSTFAASAISDSTSAGRALLTAADASAQRTSLGLGSAATSASTDFAAASHNHSASAITSGVLDNARINFAAPSAIGSTTASTGAFTTLSANNGTQTSTAFAPALTVAQTWNTVGHIFGAFNIDITNTASNANSTFLRCTIGGSSQFEVRSGGTIVTTGTIIGNAQGLACAGNWSCNSTGYVGWTSSSTSAFSGQDTFLRRDAAGIIAQYNGTNAQESRLYGTFTSSTNYQRMTIKSVRQTLSALSGASATTTGTFIPDGAVVVGVTTRVATALTGATGYTIGDGTDADRWGDITGTAIGTTSDNINWTAGTIECFTAGGNVTLTAKGSNFTAGAIEICVFYLAGEAD